MHLIRSERFWRWTVILGLTLLSSLPALFGWLNSNSQRVFIGRIPYSTSDTGPYYSIIEQVRQGRILAGNQFTSEPQQPSLLHPLWILLGWLAALTHLSTPWAFHLSRVLAVGLFLWVLERGLRVLFADWRTRLLAVVIVGTSSGLGWIIYLRSPTPPHFMQVPVDLWVSEANTMLSLMHSSLFVLSQLFLCLVYWATYQLTLHRRNTWYIGPLLLVLGLMHPYDMIPVGMVTLVWMIGWLVVQAPPRAERWRATWQYVRWWLWVIPIAPYYLLIVLHQPAMVGWLKQNVDITPGAPQMLLGYGLLWPLALSGAWRLWKTHRAEMLLLVAWVAMTLVLAYWPGLSIQRRLLNGLHIPLAILAAVGVLWFTNKVIFPRLKYVFLALAMLLLAATNLDLIKSAVANDLWPDRADYPMYLNRQEAQGLVWLRNHSTFDQVVWCDVWSGNTVAGLIARTVAFGHGNQTLHPGLRDQDWKNFIRADYPNADRMAMLKRLHITWLYWTPAEQAESTYRPAQDQRWQLDYSNSAMQIYRLQLH